MSEGTNRARREPPTYSVYVIELDPSLRKGEKAAVYVGQTTHTPEERFEHTQVRLQGIEVGARVRDPTATAAVPELQPDRLEG